MKIPTKIGIYFLMGLLFAASTGAAETRYVTDNLGITLRTGPARDRKIIAQPRAGLPLELIKAGDDYSEVRMPGGKQGWVLTQYLTSKVPASILLAELQQKHAQLVEKFDIMENQASRLNTTSKGLSGDLDATRKALEKLTAEHQTLKNESQEFLKLKAKYQKVVKEAAELRIRADKANMELEQLMSSELNTGLLYGGGLIVLGFVVGFIVKRPRRKSPLM